mmetsp:Transcript_48916/g.148881  ORF Transcript_48916/g.148881 Transcript_48916/m.148881 type:complete len:352 (+) Transcript_48916:919-1974(+)
MVFAERNDRRHIDGDRRRVRALEERVDRHVRRGAGEVLAACTKRAWRASSSEGDPFVVRVDPKGLGLRQPTGDEQPEHDPRRREAADADVAHKLLRELQLFRGRDGRCGEPPASELVLRARVEQAEGEAGLPSVRFPFVPRELERFHCQPRRRVLSKASGQADCQHPGGRVADGEGEEHRERRAPVREQCKLAGREHRCQCAVEALRRVERHGIAAAGAVLQLQQRVRRPRRVHRRGRERGLLAGGHIVHPAGSVHPLACGGGPAGGRVRPADARERRVGRGAGARAGASDRGREATGLCPNDHHVRCLRRGVCGRGIRSGLLGFAGLAPPQPSHAANRASGLRQGVGWPR